MSAEINKTIKIQGLIRGLILGGILTIISVGYFYFMISLASAVAITVGSVLFTYILPIAVAALFCLGMRKKIGGFWTLRQAATGIFIMFVISNLTIFILRDQVFARVIEPNMVEKTKNAMISALNKLKETTAKPDEKKAADAKILEMKKGFESDKSLSIGQQIEGLGVSIIFLFVLAVVFAIFFKREPEGYVSGS